MVVRKEPLCWLKKSVGVMKMVKDKTEEDLLMIEVIEAEIERREKTKEMVD